LKNIEIKNKFCIEFGYNSNSLTEGSGPNTTNLIINHNWDKLLLDGHFSNEEINLHSHFLTEDNICEIFEKYNVPLEPGYISIDVDSTDLWLMNSILQKYKPSIVSVELNTNFPIDYAITFPKNDDQGWIGDSIFGASLKALKIVADKYNYQLVYAGFLNQSQHHDAFFVRNDLIVNCDGRPTLEDFRSIYIPGHRRCTDERYKIMLDYEEYVKTGDIVVSQMKANEICKKYLC
jgi:hypothetical protein